MDAGLAHAESGLIPATLLARIPGCESGAAPLAVRVLSGGGWLNRCVAITTPEGCFVLRLRLVEGVRPGADGAQELRCQRLAASRGLAPSILDAAPDARWVLMEHVEGPMWTRADLADATKLEVLGRRLAEVHELSPRDVATLDVAPIVEGQAAMILGRNPAAAGLVDRHRRAAAVIAARLGASRLPAVLNHGDLSAANLLGPSPMLVDWEYAQRADPVYDIACLLAYYPELDLRLPRLLGAAGLDGPECAERLEVHRALFTVLNELWREAQGSHHGDPAGLVPPTPAQ